MRPRLPVHFGHPDDDAPEHHLSDEPFGPSEHLSVETLRALNAALDSLTAAQPAASPAETLRGCDDLSAQTPEPAGKE